LQSQEIKAIQKIEKAFSESPYTTASSTAKQSSRGGSLQDQLRGTGLAKKQSHSNNPMMNWKGYAGFRFVDAKGNAGEFDLLLVTHCNILIIELKDWNGGKIVSRGETWFKNDKNMGRSPVSVTRNKEILIRNKLNPLREQFTNKGRTPFVQFFVVMCGTTNFSGISEEEKKYTISLNDFLKFNNKGIFNKHFKPHPAAQKLLNDLPLLDKLFLGDNVKPKQFVVNGYKATELIFEHPKKVYREYQAISELSRDDKALLRTWDFTQLKRPEAQSPEGRYNIVSREREVLQFIKDQDYSLYQHCLRSLTPVQKDDVTAEYSEVYELPPSHSRFNEFIGKYCENFSEEDRLNLVKLLVAKFADLHEIKVAHRDLGDHSIWMSPSKEVALSSFISAYHQPLGTVGDFREELSVGEGLAPKGMQVDDKTTPFKMDVYSLGLLAWHILRAERLSPKSIDGIGDKLSLNGEWYASIIAKALDGSFEYAKDFFEELKKLEPKSDENYGFDESDLTPYRHAINHSRQFREDDDFIRDTEDKEVYESNGLLVKAWLKVSPTSTDPAIGNKVLQFCNQVRKLQDISPPYIPCIREYGLASKSSSLYLVSDFVEGKDWSSISVEEEQAIDIINALLSVIEHLHGLKIAHGDLHPENIQVNLTGDKPKIYLLDIPDFSVSSEMSFNHKYSPENIDSCTPYERDNFAVMRMGCELLGLEWGNDSEEYASISEAIIVELQDLDYGFQTLTRFKDALDFTQYGDDSDIEIVDVSIRSREPFDPVTIYPDNGKLYVQVEKDTENSGNVKVTFKGIGGQVSLFYIPEESRFSWGFSPRERNLNRRDIDECQLELSFGIRIEYQSDNDLLPLKDKVDNDEFHRAVEVALHGKQSEVSPEAGLEDEIGLNAAVIEPDDVDSLLFNLLSDKGAEVSVDTVIAPESSTSFSISTPKLWQAILDTETESHPYIEISDEVFSPEKQDDELILPYKSEIFVLDKFKKTDEIEALRIEGDKEVRLGFVQLQKSGMNEVRLKKLSYSAKRLEAGNIVYFRTKADEASYRKRKNALERLLGREGVISNLMDYFDPDSSSGIPVDYEITVTDEDFSRYDRKDDHGNKISLNQQQREAFKQILENGPLSLLQGPPGTGKTEFIAAFVHHLIEKQNVKNILLVSQSHEAVNTAAERIRKHCKRLDTSIDVVRFSNSEKVVSQGLKDVYSNALVTEKRELFRAEIEYRVAELNQALGLPANYLSERVHIELKLFDKIDKLIFLIEPDSDTEDKAEIERLSKLLANTIERELADNYEVDFSFETLAQLKQNLLREIEHKYSIAPHEAKKANALIKISIDMLDVLETERVNYDEFFARSRQLVTGTCVGIGQWHVGVAENQYDWVIIDEAARSIASELAIAMQSGKRVLLVGDHKQLPPLYSEPHKKALARKLGLASHDVDFDTFLQSDFERAFNSQSGSKIGATLLTQYRMAEPIGNMVSYAFYDTKLVNGERKIPDIYVDVPASLKSTVAWVDTSSIKGAAHQKPTKGSSIFNRFEAEKIIELLTDISKNQNFVKSLSSVVKENEPAIGVICMYAEQKKYILQKFKEKVWEDDFKALVNIDTVDSYQGKENRIIIVSVTRQIKDLSPGFLRSPNRINVALSRAMDRLVIVGATEMWRAANKDLPLGRVLQYIEAQKDSSEYKVLSKTKNNNKGEK
jgi:serine/threonine protein kinase/tRNA A37 threonylcarbamoyladenosine biosynthesis protein TsaE